MATGRRSVRALAEHLHRHLITRCPECRAAWEALGDGGQAILAMLDRELAADHGSQLADSGPFPLPAPSPLRAPTSPFAAPFSELSRAFAALTPQNAASAGFSGAEPAARSAPASADRGGGGSARGSSRDSARDSARGSGRGSGSPYSPAFDNAIRRVQEEASRLRSRRRRAERELRLLLAVPAAERRQKVLNARTRYRSRAFAELLLEESRQRVRTDPWEAAALAELVPLVVLWTPGALPSTWGDELVIRSRAWRANALRVAGALHRADHELADLRRELAGRPLGSELAGELDSLEASLRLDQGRLAEAGTCLDQAVRQLAASGRPQAWTRALIKRAELHRMLGHSTRALEDARQAQARLDPRHDTVSYLCAVGNQVLSLCDLERPAEARQLLTETSPHWAQMREDWWVLRLGTYEGRIQFGLGEMLAAEASFRATLQRCRGLDRPYEAAMTAVDLSMVLLAQGCTREVRELAREMAPVFISRNLHRETLAALALFERAARAESLTLASARRLRGFLDRSGHRSHPSADT